jgi:hypothetical protein
VGLDDELEALDVDGMRLRGVGVQCARKPAVRGGDLVGRSVGAHVELRVPVDQRLVTVVSHGATSEAANDAAGSSRTVEEPAAFRGVSRR